MYKRVMARFLSDTSDSATLTGGGVYLNMDEHKCKQTDRHLIKKVVGISKK